MVEREVELVIDRRLKRQGMRWKREDADWDDPANQPYQAQAA